MDTLGDDVELRNYRSSLIVEYLSDFGMYTQGGENDIPDPERAKSSIQDFLAQAAINQSYTESRSILALTEGSVEILNAYVDGKPEMDLHDLFTQSKRVIPKHGMDVWVQDQLRRYVKLYKKNQVTPKIEVFEWDPAMEVDLDDVLQESLFQDKATLAYAGQLRLLFGKVKVPKGTSDEVIFTALQQSASHLRRDIDLIVQGSQDIPASVLEGVEHINAVIGNSAKEIRPLPQVVAEQCFKSGLTLNEEQMRTESMIAHTISYLYGSRD